jgi:hypothetical protein
MQQPFEIQVDASYYAIGAIPTQNGHLVAYHSETLSIMSADTPHMTKICTPLCRHDDNGRITLLERK